MPDILIGLDKSTASERALDQALIEAETSGRPLHAINAWRIAAWAGGTPGMGYGYFPPPVDTAGAAKDLVHELLTQGLRRRASSVPVTATAEALEGEPGRVLVQAASDAGLVVVGSRGHGYVTGALLGSATAYVLHHAPCPVMVVPKSEEQAKAQPRVVVGMDGDAHSRSALRWGLDAARRRRCPLLVLHTWLMTMPPELADLPFSAATPDYETAAHEWLRTEVAQAAPGPQEFEVQTEVRYGSPAGLLLDASGPEDLLVVGSRGRGGFASLVLGSVATQCSQHARGTVVVVRAGQERLDPLSG